MELYHPPFDAGENRLIPFDWGKEKGGNGGEGKGRGGKGKETKKWTHECR